MRSGSLPRAFASLALLVLVGFAAGAGCGAPPDEAYLRFLGFQVSTGTGDSAKTTSTSLIEGDLQDGKTDYADAKFRNDSITVGRTDGTSGTGITITRVRVDYSMNGRTPPRSEYPLTLYLGPSSAAKGTVTATEGTTSIPIAPSSLKAWIIDSLGLETPDAAGSVDLTAHLTFFARTDEGIDLEVSGSASIVLSYAKSSDSTTTFNAGDGETTVAAAPLQAPPGMAWRES